METHLLLFQIALILFCAKLFAEIATRFNIPSIIGELTAGIILGPSLLNLIEVNDVLRLLAEIGIILLLFQVGLESDVGKLLKAGPRSVIVAIGGFVFPFILGFGTSFYLFELSVLVSLFVGGTLTATSIGVTVRILSDLGRHKHEEGQIILGAAVVDDILGVVLLAVLYEFALMGEVSLANAGKIVIFIALFFVIAPVAAKLLSYVIQHMHNRQKTMGVVPVTLMALVLSFAGLAHFVGAPELLGGFAAGIALSRRFFLPFAVSLNFNKKFSKTLHDQISPIIQLFTPIFFVVVGVSLNLQAVEWGSSFFWFFSLVILVVSIAGKIVGAWLIKGDVYLKTAVGMAMVPRGEVGLIFAELGQTSNVFNNDTYAAIIIVIAYTTLLSPFWIKLYYRRFGERLAGNVEVSKDTKTEDDGRPPG